MTERINKAKSRMKARQNCVVSKMHNADWIRVGISRSRYDVHADSASRKQINRGWLCEHTEGRKVGRARARFISPTWDSLNYQINYEFNATEATCDRKLFGRQGQICTQTNRNLSSNHIRFVDFWQLYISGMRRTHRAVNKMLNNKYQTLKYTNFQI